MLTFGLLTIGDEFRFHENPNGERYRKISARRYRILESKLAPAAIDKTFETGTRSAVFVCEPPIDCVWCREGKHHQCDGGNNCRCACVVSYGLQDRPLKGGLSFPDWREGFPRHAPTFVVRFKNNDYLVTVARKEKNEAE